MLANIPVSVLDSGADRTGVADSSAAILAADAVGSKVIYPHGTYKYSSTVNPTFGGGVDLSDGVTVNGPVVTGIFVTDNDSVPPQFLGIQQNFLQQLSTGSTGAFTPVITNGVIVPAPQSNSALTGEVDLIAHWYNDFGLVGSSSAVWNNWQWNFVGNTGNASTNYSAASNYGHDPARRPLLGWYRGADVNVLDWQCFWLRENGISAIIPTVPNGIINTATWQNPSDPMFWFFTLCNSVKNFKGMRYIPWVDYGATANNAATITANWLSVINNICGVFTNTYTVVQNGGVYLCLFVYDGAVLRGQLDGFGGATAAGQALFTAAGNAAKALGYAGVCILNRAVGINDDLYNVTFNATAIGQSTAQANGFILIAAGYSGFVSSAFDGDSQAASFTASISGTNMTVSAVGAGTLAAGQIVIATGSAAGTYVTNNTVIVSQTSGPAGGTGVYVVTNSQTVSSVVMYSTLYNTYAQLIANIAVPNTQSFGRCVPFVSTAMSSVYPHPSQYSWPGSTPALFQTALNTVIKQLLETGNPRMVTIYNVAEWAEGGAALQPSVGNGFGYLDACRSALAGTSPNITPEFPYSLQYAGPGTAILASVTITGTAGQFSCAASTLVVNQQVLITGTFGGTGSITGYASGNIYKISATNGTTTFTLQTQAGAPIVTTAGTPTGLTYEASQVGQQNFRPLGNTIQGFPNFGTQVLTGPAYHPTIQPGVDGQIINLMCIPQPAVFGGGSFSFTINSNSFESGTNLFLTASQVALAPFSTIQLQYFVGKGWVQIAPVTNTV